MDQVLMTGDQAIYNPNFGTLLVIVSPGILSGTGNATFTSKKPICVQGDEMSATVICSYTNPVFVPPVTGPYVGGMGKITITALGPDQLSTVTKCGGKPIMLKGTTFQAQFQVTIPAMGPAPTNPVPDAPTAYPGTGQFVTTNMTVKDSK